MSPALEIHLAQLGLPSVLAYRRWCCKSGFRSTVEKSPVQRAAELAHHQARQQEQAVPVGVDRDHRPWRAERIRRIFRGECDGVPLTDVFSRIRRGYLALASDADACAALEQLVLHTEMYTCFYRPAPAHRRFGAGVDNTFIAALEQLARHHRDWLRPLADWRPRGRKGRDQFAELVRHLLARYDVPRVMDAAWFQGNCEQARAEQQWFKHIGVGQNLRTAGVPTVITKRAAHLLLHDHSGHRTIPQAIRRVQVLALGGHARLADAVSWSSLCSDFAHDVFWLSVIHFFINNHPMLSVTYVDPIIDYIRHQKFELQRLAGPDGVIAERPPPHPAFSVKGRSAEKLLRQVDHWHAQLSGLEHLPLRTWEPSGLPGLAHGEADSKLGRQVEWTVVELLTSAQLGVEGRVMHHCVGSYTERCAGGQIAIWSMRVVDLEAEEPEPMHVLTIAVDPARRVVTEARGKYNLRPFDQVRQSKRRRTPGLYRHFLRESARILKRWMDRAGLRHV
jgi:hypothetical protein